MASCFRSLTSNKRNIPLVVMATFFEQWTGTDQKRNHFRSGMFATFLMEQAHFCTVTLYKFVIHHMSVAIEIEVSRFVD